MSRHSLGVILKSPLGLVAVSSFSPEQVNWTSYFCVLISQMEEITVSICQMPL